MNAPGTPKRACGHRILRPEWAACAALLAEARSLMDASLAEGDQRLEAMLAGK